MKDQVTAQFIHTYRGDLHYAKYGNGHEILLIFHGFGQSHEIATSFAIQLMDSHTIYSFDLPHHGKSDWQESKSILTKLEMKEIFTDWIIQKNINKFSVLGYSMGGKIAITLAEMFPKQVSHLVLVAPDGLYKSYWYQVATSWPIDVLFRRTIDNPNFYFRFTKQLRKTSLIPDKLIQFAESQMATRKLRAMVYYNWYNFQKLFIDRTLIKNNINSMKLRARLVVGINDSIIKPSLVIPIVEDLGFQIVRLDAGHAKVLDLAAENIEDYLK